MTKYRKFIVTLRIESFAIGGSYNSVTVKMESGCIFHFPFWVEHENNGIYTDPRKSSSSK